jgi:hypothetical protein
MRDKYSLKARKLRNESRIKDTGFEVQAAAIIKAETIHQDWILASKAMLK